jgi:ubiquinone biosynthesis protein
MLTFIKDFFKLLLLLLMLLAKAIPQRALICAYYYKRDNAKYQNSMRILGRKITEFLQYSGPTFIKLGQVVSTRPDLIGEIIAEQLSKLQDKLKPFDYKFVRRQVRADFGDSIENLFAEFSKEPVAAASIAQVHKAETKEGDRVAVKILRPRIRKRFKSDLSLLALFISFIEFFCGKYVARLKLQDVLTTLREIINFELDLRLEAAAADEIKANTAEDEGIRVPKVFWGLTSQNVLTIEWIDGIPIVNRDELIEKGFDTHDIARKLAVTFFNQVYRDGFFHADLHPGNLFVDENGDVVMVDFGIVGMLSKRERLYMAEILYGFITQDYERVSDIHFKAGYVPEGKSRKLFALACRSIGDPIIGLPVNQISIAQLLKQLFEVTKKFDMPTQTQLLLLQKTMVTIEGVGSSIYPEVNMWQLAEPWIKEWAKGTFGVTAKLKEVAQESSGILLKLPELHHEVSGLMKGLSEFVRNQQDSIVMKPKVKKKYKYYALSFLAGFVIALLINYS